MRPAGSRIATILRRRGSGIVASVLLVAALVLGLTPNAATAGTEPTAAKASATTERRAEKGEKAAARQARKLLRRDGQAVQAEDSSFAVTDVIVDANGTSHVRFDRTYRDLPVLGGDLVVHLDQGGELIDVSQTLAPGLTVDTNPSISADAAAAAADASGPTHSELVVDATGPSAYLAWAIGQGGTQGDGTPSRLTTYVDAHTGQVVREEQGIHTAAGDGIGYTQGHVPLDTTPSGSAYELKDPTRGDHYTGDAGNQADTCYFHVCTQRAPSTVLTDADNHWGDGTLASRQTVAVDAAYSTAKAWDYYKNVHGRNGIRDDGAGAHSRVHYGAGYNNAFWDPRCFCMTYGDGDGVTHGPFAALDTVGHEMTHGVTSATAGLIYGGESGGISEATSDIFGTLVEFYAGNPVDPPDYTLGEKVGLQGPHRWMDDPAKDGLSASCWSSDVGDLDVHYSSGVANHFFYLLAVGSGPSQWGDSPTCNGSTVVGIGNDAAARIWYRALTVYMTSATDYARARTATLDAARDLYGLTSPQYNAVAASWLAVNVGGSLSVGDVTVTEGDTGTATATFTVTLSPPQAAPVTVTYATADGTAIAPDDYTAAAGTLTFAAGETTKAVTVTVHGDTTAEPDERFTLNLSGSAGVNIGDGQGVATIVDEDSLSLSVDDVTATEGDAGSAPATFTVSLSAPSPRPVTVGYATADGSARSPADYGAASGTLSFAPGETTKTVPVAVRGDTVHEGDETFTVNLSDPVAAGLADGVGLGTIVDDDSLTMSVADAVAPEGHGAVSFDLTLTVPSESPVTVDYSTADGTAVAPGDYSARTGTVTFRPGETSNSVTVPVSNDNVDEPDETFTLRLANAVGAQIGDGQAEATILDDDGAPSLFAGHRGVVEGNAGTVAAVFTVSLNTPSSFPATVDYATADRTAAAPDDYAHAAGTLSFAPGETDKTVTVAVNGDVVDEEHETFTLELSNAVGAAIADGQGVGTIVDDDQPPSLSVSDASAPEGDAGTVVAVFTVSLSAPSSFPVTADYSTADGTALAPDDYTAAAGTLTFAPGETDKTVAVAVNGDTADEPDETFTLNLSNPTAASIGNGEGVGTIVDDDVSLSVSDAVVNEGNAGTAQATFTVSLSAPSAQPVTVDYATADGTAVAPGDYAAAAGTLNFAPGETAKTFAVAVNGDTVDEPDETFNVNLLNAAGAPVADSQGLGSILDDDLAGGVTTVMAWGSNYAGQLGDGTTEPRPSPGAVAGLSDVATVAAGQGQTFAIRSDGTVWGWGNNGAGQLGNGGTAHATTPVQVIGINDAVAVATSYDHSIVLRADGTVWGMGANRVGQLGPDRGAQYHTPVQVPGYGDIVAIDAGDEFNLALASDGTLWASGKNTLGQLGDGTRTIRTSPVRVLDGVVDMAAGWDYSVAVRSDGTVWSWGDEGNGIFSEGDRLTPQPVAGLTNAVAVDAGAGHYLAMRADGTAWAWGNNVYGQAGNGTTNQFPELVETPVQVEGLDDVVSIAAGNFHSLARRADGTVWAWGGNWAGQLGQGHTDHPQPLALQVPGLAGVTAVAGGDEHSVVLVASP